MHDGILKDGSNEVGVLSQERYHNEGGEQLPRPWNERALLSLSGVPPSGDILCHVLAARSPKMPRDRAKAESGSPQASEPLLLRWTRCDAWDAPKAHASGLFPNRLYHNPCRRGPI